MSEETLEIRVKMDDINVKEIVYQYIKTCEGQLDLRQCAADLGVSFEDVLKAVALLEGEGRIKVEATEPSLPEDTLTIAEAKEPQVTTPVTPSEGTLAETTIPPSAEATQPLTEPTAEVDSEETSQEKTLPPAEPEVLTENPVEPTPIVHTEIAPEELSAKTPELKPVEPVTVEKVTLATPAEAPAEKTIEEIEEYFGLKAKLEPTAPAIEAPEEKPSIPKKTLEPIVITESQIILEKPKAPKTNPTPEMPQIQQSEVTPTTESTAIILSPPSEIHRHAICPKCGLPTDTPLKQWSIKGRIAKKSVLVSLYKCPTCGTMFRGGDTMENEA